jgi:hypothetical protein
MRSLRVISLPPPALGECRHSCLTRLSVAVRWASILVMAEGQRPHPRHPYGRGVGLEDAAGDGAIRDYVIVVLIPLAGWPALVLGLSTSVAR